MLLLTSTSPLLFLSKEKSTLNVTSMWSLNITTSFTKSLINFLHSDIFLLITYPLKSDNKLLTSSSLIALLTSLNSISDFILLVLPPFL